MAAMRTHVPLSLVTAVFSVLALLTGCCKRIEDANGWSTPYKVTETQEGLGWIMPYKLGDTMIALAPMSDGSSKGLLLNAATLSWSKLSFTGLPSDVVTDPGIDEISGRIIFQQGYTEAEKLFVRLFFVRPTSNGELQLEAERKWSLDKDSIFGSTGSNVRFAESGNRRYLKYTGCVVEGADIDLVYCLAARTFFGINSVTAGPFNNGVFHSPDLGNTWEMQSVSSVETSNASVCRTKAQYYYFGMSTGSGKGHELWFSQRPVDGNLWTPPTTITKNLAKAYNRYVATTANDVVHLCWMDATHEKWNLNLQAPYRENYEIAYCHRTDNQGGWSKEIVLSKGLSYAYAPSMAADGEKVVIAWAGIEASKRAHSAQDPNDVYYVTSSDGGKSWSHVRKLTDKAKDGFTSGEPRVVLQNGTIHLLYTQGKLNIQSVSPGLTKLNQSPWPIYYTRRPFPK
jgi:hypothetical protein